MIIIFVVIFGAKHPSFILTINITPTNVTMINLAIIPDFEITPA